MGAQCYNLTGRIPSRQTFSRVLSFPYALHSLMSSWVLLLEHKRFSLNETLPVPGAGAEEGSRHRFDSAT